MAVGLGASTVMLAIATSLAVKNARSSPLVDEVGPMHLIWLAMTNPNLNRRITEVENPSARHLRQAGMATLGVAEESVPLTRKPSPRPGGALRHREDSNSRSTMPFVSVDRQSVILIGNLVDDDIDEGSLEDGGSKNG